MYIPLWGMVVRWESVDGGRWGGGSGEVSGCQGGPSLYNLNH